MIQYTTAPSYTPLLHPCSTSLVTCCDEEGTPNIIAIAWLMPISAAPPLLGMSIRQERFSYGLIKATGEFVVNVASFEIAQQALLCGRRSGSQVDKFAATGLTPLAARNVRPPIIRECLAHVECRVKQDIKLGDHNLLVGEVLAAYARSDALQEQGAYDLSRVQPLLHVGRNRFTYPAPQTIEPEIP